MQTAISKFNGLGAATVSRDYLLKLQAQAKKEGNDEIVSRISMLLNTYPEGEEFELEIETPIQEFTGLGASHHKGLAKDGLDECGRLKKGYKYGFGGEIMKVEPKKTKSKPKKVAKKYGNKTNRIHLPNKKITVIESHKEETNNIIRIRKNSKEFQEVINNNSFKVYDLRSNFEGYNYNGNLDDFDKKHAKISKHKGVYTIHVHSNLWYTTTLEKKTIAEKPQQKLNNTKGFDTKSKSVSVSTAIKDVLGLAKFKGIKQLQASIIYKHFKDETTLDDIIDIKSTYEKGVLTKENGLHVFFHTDELMLTSLGIDFVKAVNDRLESLRNQKYNHALFNGLKGISIDTDKFKNMSVAELRRFTLDYYNSNLKGKKVSIKNALKEVIFVTNTGRKMLKPMYSEKAAIVEHLEELIKKSTYNNWGNRKEKDSPNILGYLNFKSKIEIDGVKRHVRIAIAIDEERKTKLKTVEVGKIKKSGKSHEVRFRNPKVEGEKPLPENKDTEKGLNSPNLENVNTDENQEVIILDVPEQVKPVQNTPTVNHVPVVVHSAETERINKAVQNSVSHVPVVQNKPAQIIHEVSPKHKSLNYLMNNDEVNVLYDIPGDVGRFLGDVEIKPKESVAITLSSPQGGGKTRGILQFANAFAYNYRVKIFSLEEHVESKLFKDKIAEYIDPDNFERISVESELPNGINTIHESVSDFDVIMVDSWSKMLEIDSRINLDQDFRKKYDGKLFVFIFQQTSDGKMYGGAKNQFDGDIILFVEKFPDYRLSYIYPNKNRYTSTPLDQLKYNVYTQSLMQDESTETEPTEVLEL